MRIRQLLFLGLFALFFSVSAATAATLNVESGILLGASGVDVDGVLYDVSFQDGTCIELYDDCDENSDFPFANPLDADDRTLGDLASQALLAQVFIDGPLGDFDSEPDLTFGCAATSGCQVNTPLFLTGGGASVGILWIFNEEDEPQDITTGSGSQLIIFDSSIGFPDSNVYALWSESTIVPVPAAGWLLGSALGFLGWLRRRAS